MEGGGRIEQRGVRRKIKERRRRKRKDKREEGGLRRGGWERKRIKRGREGRG